MKYSSYQIIVGFVLTILVSHTTANVCDISTAFEVGKVEQKELDEVNCDCTLKQTRTVHLRFLTSTLMNEILRIYSYENRPVVLLQVGLNEECCGHIMTTEMMRESLHSPKPEKTQVILDTVFYKLVMHWNVNFVKTINGNDNFPSHICRDMESYGYCP